MTVVMPPQEKHCSSDENIVFPTENSELFGRHALERIFAMHRAHVELEDLLPVLASVVTALRTNVLHKLANCVRTPE
jgi:iron-sulfur cluster repair protein YtfE (RIC family)